MRIVSLVDPLKSETAGEEFISEGGFSPGFCVYIEVRGTRILLDTGLHWTTVSRNASALGIDLSAVDHLIISHLHLDHVGGLSEFLEENLQAKVYMKVSNAALYFQPFPCLRKYIGPKPSLRGFEELLGSNSHRIVDTGERGVGEVLSSLVSSEDEGEGEVDEDTTHGSIYEVIPGVSIVTDIPSPQHPTPQANWPLKTYDRQTRRYSRDGFEHEQFVVIWEEDRTSPIVVLSPCSHRGILNVVDEAVRLFGQIDLESEQERSFVVLGGFHFYTAPFFYESVESIRRIGEELMHGFDERVVRTLTWHCTSKWGFKRLQEVMREKVEYLRAGRMVEL